MPAFAGGVLLESTQRSAGKSTRRVLHLDGTADVAIVGPAAEAARQLPQLVGRQSQDLPIVAGVDILSLEHHRHRRGTSVFFSLLEAGKEEF